MKNTKTMDRVAVALVVIAGIMVLLKCIFTVDLETPLANANQHMEDGEYRKAIVTFEEVLDLDDTCADAYWGIAESYGYLAEESLSGVEYTNDVDVQVELVEEALDYYKEAVSYAKTGLDKTDDKSFEELIEYFDYNIDIIENALYG